MVAVLKQDDLFKNTLNIEEQVEQKYNENAIHAPPSSIVELTNEFLDTGFSDLNKKLHDIVQKTSFHG